VAGARVGVKWRNNAQFRARKCTYSPPYGRRGNGKLASAAWSFFHPDHDTVPAASSSQSDVNAMQISTGRSDRDRGPTGSPPPRSPSSTLRCRYARRGRCYRDARQSAGQAGGLAGPSAGGGGGSRELQTRIVPTNSMAVATN